MFEENLASFGNGHLARLADFREDFLEHALQVDVHLFQSHPTKNHGRRALFGRDLDTSLVQFAVDKHGVELGARALVLSLILLVTFAEQLGFGHEEIEESFFDAPFGFLFDLFAFAFPHESNGVLDQFPHHAFDIAAVVADFGVFRRFDFDEGGASQARQPPRDFRLADAGGADHEDVLRGHIAAHLFGKPLPPPSIADGDGHGTFGVILADDVAVERRDDFSRRERLVDICQRGWGCQFRHSISSTIRRSLV